MVMKGSVGIDVAIDEVEVENDSGQGVHRLLTAKKG
jgi:hypothetical protein